MKRFNNLKMIQKLLSSFFIVALFLGIVGVIGVINMKNIDKNISNIYNFDLIGVDDISNIKANLLEIRGDMLLIIDPLNKGDLKKTRTILINL